MPRSSRQELCDVCAVSYKEVTEAVKTIEGDITNDGVGITFNDKLVPTSIQDQVNALRKKVVSGDIKVDSALK